MQKTKASETAIRAAVVRATHQILDGNPKILSDPIAKGFVPGASEPEIREREEEYQQPQRQLTRSHVVLRSRFAEDQLCEATKDGIRQYLILGAGFDTFAYRQPAWASELSIIEVDHPATQAMKQDYLSKAGIAPANNVSFCPIDFEHTSLTAGIASSPFDPHVPTVVSWLGVTMYITRPAIEETFQFVLSLPSPSRIVFTFTLPPSAIDDSDVRERIESIMARTAELGEPIISLFEPSELQEWLLALGFSDVFHLSPEQAQERYFANRSDGLFVPSSSQIMCAYV